MNALLQQAQTSSVDHTKATESNFEYQIPPAGATPARFVGYVETGKRPQEYQGKAKAPALEAMLFFELNGPKHRNEVDTDDGKKVFTNRIRVNLTVKTGDKAAFGKLFRAMRYGRENITHMAQMLGEGFLVTVVHNKVGEGDKERTYANIRDADGVWKIGEPILVDPLDPDNVRKIPVPEATQDFMLLLWDNPTKEQWDSIFIDGTRTVKDKDGNEKEVSKNWMQEEVLKAVDIENSALADLLAGLGDLSFKADSATEKAEEGDPLAGDTAPAEEPKKPATEEKSGVSDEPKAKDEKPATAAEPDQSADDILAALGMS